MAKRELALPFSFRVVQATGRGEKNIWATIRDLNAPIALRYVVVGRNNALILALNLFYLFFL